MQKVLNRTVESGRGALGCYIVSDGTPKPYMLAEIGWGQVGYQHDHSSWMQDYQNRGWEISPTMTLGGFDTPQEIYIPLRDIAEAVLRAAHNFSRQYP